MVKKYFSQKILGSNFIAKIFCREKQNYDKKIFFQKIVGSNFIPDE